MIGRNALLFVGLIASVAGASAAAILATPALNAVANAAAPGFAGISLVALILALKGSPRRQIAD